MTKLSGSLTIPTNNKTLTAGYMFGGQDSNYVTLNTIDKFVFDTKTCAKLSSVLSSVRYGAYGFAGNGLGYMAGGAISAVTNMVETIDPLTESVNKLSLVLRFATVDSAETQSLIKGYIGGGRENSNRTKVIHGLVFSTNSAITNTLSLEEPRHMLAGFSSAVKGYYSGGETLAGGYVNKIESLLFDTETVTKLSTGLDSGRLRVVGIQSDKNGYTVGGNSSIINRLVFATEINSVLSATLSAARYNTRGINSAIAGYITGGDGGLNKIEEISFITETRSNVSATLSISRRRLGSLSI